MFRTKGNWSPDLNRLQGSHTQELQIMYWDDRSTLDPQWYVNDSLSEGACVLYVGHDVRFENHFTNDIVIFPSQKFLQGISRLRKEMCVIVFSQMFLKVIIICNSINKVVCYRHVFESV